MFKKGYDIEYYGSMHKIENLNNAEYLAGIKSAQQKIKQTKQQAGIYISRLCKMFGAYNEYGEEIDPVRFIKNNILKTIKENNELPKCVHNIVTKQEILKLVNTTGYALVQVNPEDEKGIPVSEYVKGKICIEIPWYFEGYKNREAYINYRDIKFIILDELNIIKVFLPTKKNWSANIIKETK